MRLAIFLMVYSSMLLAATTEAPKQPKRVITACALCRTVFGACTKATDKPTYGRLSDTDELIACENEYAGCFLTARCFLEGR